MTRTGRKWTLQQVKNMLDDYEKVYQNHSKLGETIKGFMLKIA